MSYSGELAYEIHVPVSDGEAMWRAVIAEGEPFGIMPYGTEAMSTLRIEKGHIVIGPEADGRTTADDLGLGKMVSPAKGCIGKPLAAKFARSSSINPSEKTNRPSVLWGPMGGGISFRLFAW